MPYFTQSGKFQESRRLGHVPIVQNRQVREKLESYTLLPRDQEVALPSDLMHGIESISSSRPRPRWVFSFDGSPSEVATDEQYPSTRVGYLQIAGVLIDLDSLLSESSSPLVDPSVIEASSRESLYSLVMPSSNVRRSDLASVRETWRVETYELFRDYQIEGESLLDAFTDILRAGGRLEGDSIVLERCPSGIECNATDIPCQTDGSECPVCGSMLFPTDVLRIHEEVSEHASNMTPLGRLMSVLEQLTFISFLRFLSIRHPRALRNTAFIVDGPLALFGPPAPLKRAIASYLERVHHDLLSDGIEPPLILGIEKSGHFVEHAHDLADLVDPGTLIQLPDSYIYERILVSRGRAASSFGEDTYYGQKFIYKTRRGQIVVLTVPRLNLDTHSTPSDPTLYRTLPASLLLLDQIGTKLYQDGLIPVALAHDYASIPLRTGSRVLQLLTRELINGTLE